MRQNGKRSAGLGRGLVLLTTAAVAVVAVGLWPDAAATPSRSQVLTTICTSPGGECKKLLAIEELCSIDTSVSRDALSGLADGADERVAVMAIGALCRRDFSGARAKVMQIFGDTNRSEFTRMAAMTAYCCVQYRDGKTWTQIKRYVKDTAGTNTRLRAQWADLKSKFWSTEADND
jgi:hypothetical protein